MTTPLAVARPEKYREAKVRIGGITLVTLHGTLNEDFNGRKLVASLHTKKLILEMSDVRRFASWGMQEWMDFLHRTADRDVYLIECSTYAVSQLNLITGLLGHAKLVSFYASYLCANCGTEMKTLFLTPRDAIREIPGSEETCSSCGSRAPLEQYPAAFFDTIASRPAFDIDDEVLAFLRSRRQYDLSPDLTRFRVYRRHQKGYTYLRLTGNIATLQPDLVARASEGMTVVDLEGIFFDRERLDSWRTYSHNAMSRVTSLHLLGCPDGFLEAGVRVQDLHDKLKVRTFTKQYRCNGCGATSIHMIDVAANLEEIVEGILPSAKCLTCGSNLVASSSEGEKAVLRALPARDRDPVLETFLAKARTEPSEKLENCIATMRAEEPGKPVVAKRPIAYAVLASVVIVVMLGIIVALLDRRTSAPPNVNPAPVVTPQQPPTVTRPDWIISDAPSSAYCHDMITRLMCVGVSSYHGNKEDGTAEATEAALEELVSTVALKVSEPYFRQSVMPVFSEARNKALSALQQATLSRTKDAQGAAAYAAANNTVRAARRRVIEALQATGGAAVPTQRADWYWEEYAKEGGGLNTEFLVYVRFDVSMDAVRALVDTYSRTTQVLGSTVMTAFPGLAWRIANFRGGALITKVARPLALAGVTPQQLVIAINAQPITDASSFAQHVEHSRDHPIALTVVDAGGAEKILNLRP